MSLPRFTAINRGGPGRPIFTDRVTALRNSDSTLTFALSADIAKRLRLSDGDTIIVGFNHGADGSRYWGYLLLARARGGDQAVVPVYGTRGQQIRFNMRKAFLPGVQVPEKSVTLPHHWSIFRPYDDVLNLDLSPLRTLALANTG